MLRRNHSRNRRTHRRNQQSVSVHTVRRAGHQRHPVLTGHDLQLRSVIRFDHRNAIHLITERTTHHFDVEVVADTHLIQAREHHRLNQPTVAGDHRMRAPPAHWQAAAIQVARAGSERRLRRAMVDRQTYGDLRNADGAHHATAGIEQTLIFRILRTGAI